MKFKIIGKEKRGFARYCPTFAKGYEGMREGIWELKVRRLAKKLENKDWHVRWIAAEALGNTVWKGGGITIAMPALVKALRDENDAVRFNVTGVLRMAAEKKVDITVAIPALMKALGDEEEDVRRNAALAFEYAVMNGADITAPILVLLEAFSHPDWRIRMITILLLGKAASKCDHDMQETIVAKMMELVRSDGFMREAERNSDAFILTAKALDQALKTIKKPNTKLQEARS